MTTARPGRWARILVGTVAVLLVLAAGAALLFWRYPIATLVAQERWALRRAGLAATWLRSVTRTERGWPFSSKYTVRVPSSCTSLTAARRTWSAYRAPEPHHPLSRWATT